MADSVRRELELGMPDIAEQDYARDILNMNNNMDMNRWMDGWINERMNSSLVR